MCRLDDEERKVGGWVGGREDVPAAMMMYSASA